MFTCHPHQTACRGPSIYFFYIINYTSFSILGSIQVKLPLSPSSLSRLILPLEDLKEIANNGTKQKFLIIFIVIFILLLSNINHLFSLPVKDFIIFFSLSFFFYSINNFLFCYQTSRVFG